MGRYAWWMDPSLLQEATNIASASASFSISHSPGKSGRVSPAPSPLVIAPRTAAPRTLMTVSCARELISFAFLISWSSSGVFINLA